jgi:diguanylate cyclase (GGDEF)-like protein
MSGEDDYELADQSDLRMRAQTLVAGVLFTYVVCGASAVYTALTWNRPHRALIALIFGAGIAGAAVVSQLPRERIVRSRYRELFFLGWSMLDLALIFIATRVDGGTASPLALIFFLPVLFSAMSYPFASVIAVGGVSVAGYLTIAVSVGGERWSYEALFAAMLACACGLCAWLAGNLARQRSALLEVSRTDPLTGCLNRRGFAERAIGEIAAAARGAGEGAVVLLDVDHLKEVNDRLGHVHGDRLLNWVVTTLRENVRPGDAIGRLGGDEFALLFAGVDPSHALLGAERITQALAERAPCSMGLATFPLDGSDLEELLRNADARLYASRHGRPQHGRTSSNERLSWAETLAHAVDLRMNAEHAHSRAVAEYAVEIATVLGWEDEQIGMLRIAAMLHDIGKMTVPDHILSKPGPLTADEFELVERHSGAGADLVARIEGLEPIVPWIRHSHERFDGGGYPAGLRGGAIPQASRILLVADAFDAITSARPYREARSRELACEELRRNAGGQFDPRCVQALLELLRERGDVGTRRAA